MLSFVERLINHTMPYVESIDRRPDSRVMSSAALVSLPRRFVKPTYYCGIELIYYIRRWGHVCPNKLAKLENFETSSRPFPDK